MKKQTRVLKLTALAGAMAALFVGCASSGVAHYDRDNRAVGTSAQIETGTAVAPMDEAAARSTVSALSFSPETRPAFANKWPVEWNIRTIDTYTFRVPAGTTVAAGETTTGPEFAASMQPGAVFVEAAGGAGETRTVRVIQHSPNPR